jgi:hypothetical protein
MPTAVDALLETNDEISALWERLKLADSDAVDMLRELEAKRPALVNEAKKELREGGAGSTKIGAYQFRVSSGSDKKVYDSEDIVEEAEERGHMDELFRYGVIGYTVNPTQMERLNPELRAIYGQMFTLKKGTLRVTIPKALQ